MWYQLRYDSRVKRALIRYPNAGSSIRTTSLQQYTYWPHHNYAGMSICLHFYNTYSMMLHLHISIDATAHYLQGLSFDNKMNNKIPETKFLHAQTPMMDDHCGIWIIQQKNSILHILSDAESWRQHWTFKGKVKRGGQRYRQDLPSTAD